MEKFVYKYKNQNLTVCFSSDDIRKVNANVIVIGEGPRLDVDSLVTQTLLENTPMFKERRQEFKSKHSFLELWSVTHSFLGTEFEYVIHAVMDTGNNEIWLKKMKSLYHKVFKEVEKLKQHSVALPLLGTGAASADSCLAVRAMVSSILLYKAERHIKIIIVSKDRALLDETATMLSYRQFYPEPSMNLCQMASMAFTEFFEAAPHRSPVPDKPIDKPLIKVPTIFRHQNQFQSDEDFEIIVVEEARRKGKIQVNAKNRDDLQDAIRLSKDEMKRSHGHFNSKSHIGKGSHSREDYEFQRAIELSKRDSAANPMSVTTSVKPSSLLSHSMTNEKNTDSCVSCPICLSLVTEPKQLDKCGHIFCKDCIDRSFREYKPVCPSCNMVYGVITGNQPDGQMDVGYSGDHLPGYEGHGTITIIYYFPSGTQGDGHPNPGQPFKGTTRRAYLPDNREGREVLQLLRTAFDRKLIFTVGRSTTTGQDGVITWNDIHHKTNMYGGPTRFGYPDPTYLSRVREELNSKGVTKSTTTEHQRDDLSLEKGKNIKYTLGSEQEKMVAAKQISLTDNNNHFDVGEIQKRDKMSSISERQVNNDQSLESRKSSGLINGEETTKDSGDPNELRREGQRDGDVHEQTDSIAVDPLSQEEVPDGLPAIASRPVETSTSINEPSNSADVSQDVQNKDAGNQNVKQNSEGTDKSVESSTNTGSDTDCLERCPGDYQEADGESDNGLSKCSNSSWLAQEIRASSTSVVVQNDIPDETIETKSNTSDSFLIIEPENKIPMNPRDNIESVTPAINLFPESQHSEQSSEDKDDKHGICKTEPIFTTIGDLNELKTSSTREFSGSFENIAENDIPKTDTEIEGCQQTFIGSLEKRNNIEYTLGSEQEKMVAAKQISLTDNNNHFDVGEIQKRDKMSSISERQVNNNQSLESRKSSGLINGEETTKDSGDPDELRREGQRDGDVHEQTDSIAVDPLSQVEVPDGLPAIASRPVETSTSINEPSDSADGSQDVQNKDAEKHNVKQDSEGTVKIVESSTNRGSDTDCQESCPGDYQDADGESDNRLSKCPNSSWLAQETRASSTSVVVQNDIPDESIETKSNSSDSFVIIKPENKIPMNPRDIIESVTPAINLFPDSRHSEQSSKDKEDKYGICEKDPGFMTVGEMNEPEESSTSDSSFEIIAKTETEIEGCQQTEDIAQSTSNEGGVPTDYGSFMMIDKSNKDTGRLRERADDDNGEEEGLCGQTSMNPYNSSEGGVNQSDKYIQCPICFNNIQTPKQLDKCGHIFCKDCIDQSFREYKPVCPSCNMVYGVITGNQPDGQMDVGYSGEHLPGYEGHGTITITYYFPSGTQGEGHPNPGQPYKGTTRRAYLPDCTEGKTLLKLLETAFDRKLTFSVGPSANGPKGGVTWNGIPHKTSIDGGPDRDGYPDPDYLTRVRKELTKRRVTE